MSPKNQEQAQPPAKEEQAQPHGGQNENADDPENTKPEAEEAQKSPHPGWAGEGQRREAASDENEGRSWRRNSKTLAFWIIFILVAIVFSKFFGSTPPDDIELSYKEYRELLKQGKIESAVIIAHKFHGTLRDPEYTGLERALSNPTRPSWSSWGP